jgi:hypothetical protein
MIVGVKYANGKTPGVFDSREYSYLVAPGLGLKVGDIVPVPVGDGERMAKVTTIGIPESKLDERILPNLKTITGTPQNIPSADTTQLDLFRKETHS